MVNDTDHGFRGNGGPGDGVDFVGLAFAGADFYTDSGVSGSVKKLVDKGLVLVNLVAQSRGFLAVEYFHARKVFA